MEIHVGDVLLDKAGQEVVVIDVGARDYFYTKPLLANGNLGLGGTCYPDRIGRFIGRRMPVEEVITRCKNWFGPEYASLDEVFESIKNGPQSRIIE